MNSIDSVQGLIDQAVKQGIGIWEIVAQYQTEQSGISIDDLRTTMEANLKVMEESVEMGVKNTSKSNSGLVGGDAAKLKAAVSKGKTICGEVMGDALVRAIAVSELNACMGKIVAAPTAGSCGIIPAALLTIAEHKNIQRQELLNALFTAAGVGMVIAKRATLSGAEGGCQAECGSASAMAAAAITELLGGTPQMAGHACAIALKNVLGLVCDPVAGLVEVPCVKRNAMGVANSLVAAELALAGIESKIPVDEVIDAMKSIGNMMATALKETSLGGLAATPTAKEIKVHE